MSKTDMFVGAVGIAGLVASYLYGGWMGVLKVLGGAVVVFIGLVIHDYRRFQKQKAADELRGREG